MRRLRTISSRRLRALAGAVAALAISGGIAQAALTGDPAPPPPKPLDQALHDALDAPRGRGRPGPRHVHERAAPGRLAARRQRLAARGRRVGPRLDRRRRPRAARAAVRRGRRPDRDRPRTRSASTTPPRSRSSRARCRAAGTRRGDRDDVSLADVRGGLDRLARAWTLSGARPGSTGGQPSYTVRIAPKDDGGLLGAAELAWDAARGVPLRAAVYAQGQSDPVLELEATDVAYGEVPAGDLRVQAPAGTRDHRDRPPGRGARRAGRARAGARRRRRRGPAAVRALGAGVARRAPPHRRAAHPAGRRAGRGERVRRRARLRARLPARGRRRLPARWSACPRSTSTAPRAPSWPPRSGRWSCSSTAASPTPWPASSRRSRPRTSRGGSDERAPDRGDRPRQALRRPDRGRPHRPLGARGRRLRLSRAQRRRQDDVAAHAPRPHPAGCGQRAAVRARPARGRGARPGRRRRLRRGAALLPVPERAAQPAARGRARRRRRGAPDRRGARHGRPRRPRGRQGRRLLARHAPAARHRRRAAARAAPAAARRADDRAGPGRHARHAAADPARWPTRASPCCSPRT